MRAARRSPPAPGRSTPPPWSRSSGRTSGSRRWRQPRCARRSRSRTHAPRRAEAPHTSGRAAVLAEMQASRDELRPFSRDYRLLGRDGQVVWIHDESVPIVGADGRPEFIQGYFIDVTERKELERNLMQAQKSEALGRMATGI